MCFFGKKYIGLDIADGSIEAVLVKEAWGQAKLISLGRVILPSGLVRKGHIVDREKLAAAVKEVLSGAKPKAITKGELCFGLPESQTFLHHFYLPAADSKQKQELIEKELLENVPIEKNDLVYSYRILSTVNEKIEILVVASKREVVNEWLKFFKELKWVIKSFDIEILATFRNLFGSLPKEPVMLLDVGSSTTFVGIFDEFGLHHEYVINKAGDYFTAAIAKAADCDSPKAEDEKIKFGLKSRDKKVVKALESELDLIIAEIKQSLLAYQTENNKAIGSIVLVGGSSLLPGLSEYFSKALELAAEVGVARMYEGKMPLLYTEAIGLTLRRIERHWDKTDPDIF